MRKFTAKAVKRDWVASVVKRSDLKYLNTANKFIYSGDYPPDAWDNWGNRRVTPFDAPYGTDSTKTFGELG